MSLPRYIFLSRGLFLNQETLMQTGLTEGYPKPCKIYEMQLLAKIINSFQPLTIFATVTILDV